MAVKEVKYSRTFLSKTTEVDVGHHKSEWASAQGLNDEDANIRYQIRQMFEFDRGGGSMHGSDLKMFGFDGKMQYSFSISGHPRKEADPLKSIPYQTEVYIRKAGSGESVAHNIDSASDLELFLLNNKFELQRK